MEASSATIRNPYETPGDLAAEAAALNPERLSALEAWARQSAAQNHAPEWRKQGERALADKSAGAEAHYAHAALLAALGERDEAARQLVVLCDRLSQTQAWPAVALVARRALELDAGPAAARWLVRAVDESGTDEEQFEALEIAHDAAPTETKIAWRLARAYDERGERAAAVATTRQTLEAVARRREVEALDEVLIYVLERPDAERLRLVFEPLRAFVKSGEGARVADFLEMAAPALRERGLARETWQTLRKMLVEAPDPQPLRRLVPESARAALPGVETLDALLAESGLNGSGDVKEALALFDKLLPFSAGRFAEHSSWGVGRVTESNREEIWLDFRDRKGHRMTLRAAHQALTPLADDDLAVLAARQPDELARLRREDPVDLVARALRRIGREATNAELKRILTHYAVPAAEWTSFWNAAKKRFGKDPRVDESQAYRGRYTLGSGEPGEGDPEGAELPRFDRGADASKVLTTLRRFVDQHPDEAAHLARERGGVLRAWRDDAELNWKERLTAQLLLVAGGGEADAEAAPAVAAEAFVDGFELRELVTAAEQARVLEWGLTGDGWREAGRSGLASRFAEVRQRAFDALQQRLGAGAGSYFEDIARNAARYPDAALWLLEQRFKGKVEPPPVLQTLAPWSAARGLAELLESAPAAAHSRSALSLLTPKGALARAAREVDPGEDTRIVLERLLAHWRGSDRTRLPFLEWVEAAGLADEAERVRDRRHQEARAVTASQGPVAPHEMERPFMTRATVNRLRREAEALQSALRGEIPAAIQKARELGDLRENAEYESAKLKQRQAQARLEQLADRILRPMIIDDLEPPKDAVGLGSEVELELAGGERRVVWLLGEGDDHLGAEVVSYRAPLGRALYDRKVGEQIEFPSETGPLPAVITAIRTRLP